MTTADLLDYADFTDKTGKLFSINPGLMEVLR
jgi:hypothetical protein